MSTEKPDQLTSASAPAQKPSPAEGLKANSDYLKGEIPDELANQESSFSKGSVGLLKHHGTYQQDNRDRRKELKKSGGEKAFSMMIRTKIPGGRLTSEQLLAEIDLGDEVGDQTLRVTTRQGLQLHGVLKNNLHKTIARINEVQLSTLGACGDVNRNVMANPAPFKNNRLYERLQELADQLAAAFTPQTRAYHEIWLTELSDTNGQPAAATTPEDNNKPQAPEESEKQLVGGGEPEPVVEPLYGRTYLPRKFKQAIALPEDNAVDIHANDIGWLAIHDGQDVLGYNVYVGGGMGTTPSAKKTFPALAKPLCYITPQEAIPLAAAIIKVQRDHGNRSDRKVARMKYLIHRWGLEKFRQTVAEYYGKPLQPPQDVSISNASDHLGWHEQGDGKLFYGLYVENGRIKDEGDYRIKAAIRAICTQFRPGIRLTGQQNILFTEIDPQNRQAIEDILTSHGVPLSEQRTPSRRLSMACPAMPMCGLSVAESERVHPQVMDQLDALIAELGLSEEVFSVHMTGCPNGCARPYNSDLGFVGKTLGKYTIFVGGNFLGTRLNFIYKDLVPFDEILPTIRPLFERFASQRQPGERFGDFCDRLGPEGLGAEGQRVLPV